MRAGEHVLGNVNIIKVISCIVCLLSKLHWNSLSKFVMRDAAIASQVVPCTGKLLNFAEHCTVQTTSKCVFYTQHSTCPIIALKSVVKVRNLRVVIALQAIPCTGKPSNFTDKTHQTLPWTAPSKLCQNASSPLSMVPVPSVQHPTHHQTFMAHQCAPCIYWGGVSKLHLSLSFIFILLCLRESVRLWAT